MDIKHGSGRWPSLSKFLSFSSTSPLLICRAVPAPAAVTYTPLSLSVLCPMSMAPYGRP